MQKDSVKAIVKALNESGVRYLVVGGLAVVAHGHLRFTADVDLVLAFDETNLRAAVAALKKLNYQPRAPVPFDDFTLPAKRAEWIQQKHMLVFSLFSPSHLATEIDLFIEPPFDFDRAYADSVRRDVAPGIEASVCSFADLIALKTKANRGIDQLDIAELKTLHTSEKNDE